MENEKETTPELDALLDLLKSEPEDVALTLLSTVENGNNKEREKIQRQLRNVCSVLFRRIETLNRMYGELTGREDESPLSGLTELYCGEEDEGDGIVAETIFGQIDLQNQALHALTKKSIKKICSAMLRGGSVCLLDEHNVSDVESADDNAAEDNGDETEDDNVEAHPVDNGDNDEQRRRIEDRMRRAMEDMEDEEDQDEEEDASDDEGSQMPRAKSDPESQTSKTGADEYESNMIDPVADELNDGFFNLNEMEQFADEEEEYLPDEAFGEEKPENEDEVEDKRSFHQKQRDGDLDDNEEEDSEEDENNGLLFRKETTVRRKRYREDDEIDALHKLYQDADNEDDDDDDSAVDAANMTAVDFFGKPNKKFLEKYHSTKASKNKDKYDEDSWDEFDFEEKNDERTGWNDDAMDKEDMNDGESDGDEQQDIDEAIPMKSAGGKKAQNTGFVKKTDKLEKMTEELEREMLAEKPWQMRGETSATARPVDSLLDITPEFELATKQAPIITVEKTMTLEEVIKKRILDEDWDDVIPRELPDVAWNKNRGELPEVSQEKSKLGLGELYEREYMKKALGYDAEAAEKETEEEKAKNEIRSLFANLCSKLDALSNYHFAPRPIADEAEIKTVTKPAIAMEEVLPLHVSEARAVAPEEVYAGKRGRDAVLRGESELEQQERKRLRAAKKTARRKARKEKTADEKLISKLQPGLGLNNPYEKRKMREELAVARAQGKITTGQADTNDYGKSTTFFKRMQQEAQQSIRGMGAGVTGEEDAKRKSKSSAVKL